MSQQSRTALKSYFETGDTPTEAEFINLIDSLLNITDDVGDRYVKLSLSSAQILALNSTPIEIVATPGAGKILLPTYGVVKYNFVSAAYAVSNVVQINHSTGTTNNLLQTGSILNAVADRRSIMAYGFGDNTDYPENDSLEVNAETSNPTTGDGTIDVYLWYKILTL